MKKLFIKVKNLISRLEDILIALLKNKPVQTISTIFIVLFLLILCGKFFRDRSKTPIKETQNLKEVQIFQIGQKPKVTVQAKVNKENVISIIAASPGIVSNIYVNEGDQVSSGKTLLSLSSNYNGANVASLQKQMAKLQYDQIQDTFQSQIELIDKQKELAKTVDENSDELRELMQDSIDDSHDTLDEMEAALAKLTSYSQTSIAWPTGTIIDDLAWEDLPLDNVYNYLIESQKQSLEGSIKQIKASLRELEYQADDDKPPAKLANFQRDIAIKQLDLQEKALTLQKEIAYLSYKIAAVAESLMFPTSPVVGVIEKVHVSKNEMVQAGTVLFTINGREQILKAEALVSKKIAKSISRFDASIIHLDNQEIMVVPDYIATEATNGNLYTIQYSLPASYCNSLMDGEYLTVDLAIDGQDTNTVIPFIPLESIYQSRDGSYVYLFQDGQVKSQAVRLGEIYGSYVAVLEGLNDQDKVILNRDVIAGQTVTLTK